MFPSVCLLLLFTVCFDMWEFCIFFFFCSQIYQYFLLWILCHSYKAFSPKTIKGFPMVSYSIFMI